MANKKVSQLTSKPSVLTTDLFPIADPSTGQLYKTTISDLGTAIGSGVSSVNGLVGAVVLDTDDIQELVSPTNKWFTDTRARAALSASSPLTYNSGTGVFGIQVANGSQNGYLSSADWTTFNAKQAALSGTGFVKSTGGTISYDTNTYLTTSSAASTYLALAGGTMTGALFGASASFSGYVGFNGNTSPLYPVDVAGSGRFSGDLRIESTNPRIYLTDTDNNPDYFISNTDGTFTVYDVTNSASRLTIGTSGAATFLNSVTASALYVTGMTAGSGAIYHTGSRLTFANYNASGTLHFEVNGGTGALTINADKTSSFLGGITVTPSTTYATIVTGGIQLQSYASTNNLIGLNSYFNGTVDKYYDNGFANQIQVNGGVFYFKTAPSGVAGNNITYTTALTIANTGAATFSSSVTATSATFSGNISMQAPTGVGTFISFKNDSNTSGFDIGHLNGGGAGAYIYQRANQPIIFGTNNAEIVRFLANGNVGIGTTSPASKLHIEGTGTGAWLTINRTDSGTNLVDYTQSGTRLGYIGYIGSELWINNATASDISIRTSGSERMRITSGGNVGIGTGSPANYTNYITQTINGTNGAIVQLQSSGTPSLRLIGEGVDSYLDNVSTGALIFRTTSSSSERMRITSGGNVTIGDSSTDNTGKLYYASPGVGAYNGVLSLYHSTSNVSGSGYVNFYVNSSVIGSIGQVGSTAVAYYTTSDYRLKEDLKPINGLEIVNKIKVYDYKWKAEDSRMDGVLAHELAEILPYAVTGEKDGERMQGVDYSKIVPVLIQSIKELKSKIETLENK